MMHYQRIENALKVCSSHVRTLDPANLRHKELETFLIAGLVVLIVSEYEEYLESLFLKRAQKCGDEQAVNFIRNTLSQKFRSPDLSKINNTLSSFDVSYKDKFISSAFDSPEHSAWDSLMKARHAVVHKKGSLNLTFGELENNYPLTKRVITSLEAILGLTPVKGD